LVIGAPRESIKGKEKQGAVYIYNCSSLPCEFLDRILAVDGDADDLLGQSVHLTDSLLFISAPAYVVGGGVYIQGFFFKFFFFFCSCSIPPLSLEILIEIHSLLNPSLSCTIPCTGGEQCILEEKIWAEFYSGTDVPFPPSVSF